MSETSGKDYGFFWDSEGDDRLYNADSFSDWLKKFFTTGVFYGDLQVTADEGMEVAVGAGYANISGKVRCFDQTGGLVIETAHATYDRIDTVVVERNDSDREIIIKIVKGGYSSNPSPVAPVRADGVYQLVLAEVYVAAGATSITQSVITDKRADTDVCGYVTCPVDTFDFGQFATQFDAYLAEFKAESAADWTTWAAAEKTAFEAWEAGEKSDYESWEAVRQAAFDTWFASIQDVLDEDTAGHLLNMINDIRDGISGINQGKTITFQSDGSIVEELIDGRKVITTFPANGDIVETAYAADGITVEWTNTTSFLANGDIQEVVS